MCGYEDIDREMETQQDDYENREAIRRALYGERTNRNDNEKDDDDDTQP